MKIKQIVPEYSDDPAGMYVLCEDGRLLHGYWKSGKIIWRDVTPEEDDVQSLDQYWRGTRGDD